MSHNNLTDKKALDAAIEMEEKGYNFFKDTAARAADKFAKEVFDFLAGEELKHIEAIKKFHAGYMKGNSAITEELISGMKSDLSKALDHLFKQLGTKVPVEGSELDAYRFALDFELKGEAFYIKAESEAVDPNAKKLYGFLIGEERRHFKIVDSCLSYFENPAEFFHQREKWHVEG